MTGLGIYHYGRGKKYFGEWKNNHIHGYGECYYSDGKKYFGYYKLDKKNGFGIFFWPKNKYYIGFWKDGKQNGMAKFIKDKEIKYGIWKEGKKEKWFKSKEEFIINLSPTEEKYFNIFMWDKGKINNFFEIDVDYSSDSDIGENKDNND
jgi:hypothetical protein